MRHIHSRRRPVSRAERQAALAAGERTLADVLARNAEEHAAGCHGATCPGDCTERTRRRWTAAGWTDDNPQRG